MHQQSRVGPALVAAKFDEALTHGQVMYGLIKPTKDLDQVESTAAMVNVLPRKRIYVMMNVQELDLFTAELMKRPLVIQPCAYIGRGLSAINFTLCTRQEKWIVMINQTHPKIIGYIQTGIAGAKQRMAAGEPFVLEFSFNAFLKRVYLDRLTKAALNANFTVIDFENAEMIIRFPGNAAHRNIMWELKTPELKFTFDELVAEDLVRRTARDGSLECQDPALRILPPDELSHYLPGWNFMEEDFLNQPSAPPDEESEEELEGATGGYNNVDNEPAPPSGGRMVGRRGRTKKDSEQVNVPVDLHHDRRQYEVPIELHVPHAGGPQVLQRGSNANTPSPLSDTPPTYEDTKAPPSYNEPDYRDRFDTRKHDDNSFPVLSVPKQSPYSNDVSQNQQYHAQGTSRDVSRSPVTPKYNTDIPRTPTTPKYNTDVPRTPPTPNYNTDTSRTPTTPKYNADVQRQTPTSPRYSGNDSYGNVPGIHSKTDSNDDGGFISHSRQHGVKVDANSNRTGEVDRYGNPVNVRTSPYAEERTRGYGEQSVNRGLQQGYAESSTSRQTFPPRDNDSRGNQYQRDSGDRPMPPPRHKQVFKPIDRPEPSPRGLHHHQGSGRSVSSTSDSGFGETENGVDSHRQKPDMVSDHGLQFQTKTKTPHYNRAYVQESPEQSPIREQPGPSMDDIMAQHAALAAKMLQGETTHVNNNHHGYNHHDNRNESDHYNKELQRYRQNINDLEDACDVPDVDFSRSRLQIHPQGEPMEESFI